MREMLQVEFDLKFGDETVHVSSKVPDGPSAPRRLLPLFQGLSHHVVKEAVSAAGARGESVSCKAGCGACCRELVGLSRTEARAIAALVEAMPEPRRAEVRARFDDAIERIDRAGLLSEVEALDATDDQDPEALNAVYMRAEVPCPFLIDESCSIHPQRPIICREYLVTSSPEHCREPAAGGVRLLPLRDSVSRAVVRLEGEPGDYRRVPLVLALRWAEAHREDEPARPAVESIGIVLRELTGRTLGEPAAPK